jgi:hypothetical protein
MTQICAPLRLDMLETDTGKVLYEVRLGFVLPKTQQECVEADEIMQLLADEHAADGWSVTKHEDQWALRLYYEQEAVAVLVYAFISADYDKISQTSHNTTPGLVN